MVAGAWWWLVVVAGLVELVASLLACSVGGWWLVEAVGCQAVRLLVCWLLAILCFI